MVGCLVSFVGLVFVFGCFVGLSFVLCFVILFDVAWSLLGGLVFAVDFDCWVAFAWPGVFLQGMVLSAWSVSCLGGFCCGACVRVVYRLWSDVGHVVCGYVLIFLVLFVVRGCGIVRLG